MDILKILSDSWYYNEQNTVEEVINSTTEMYTLMKTPQTLLTVIELTRFNSQSVPEL